MNWIFIFMTKKLVPLVSTVAVKGMVASAPYLPRLTIKNILPYEKLLIAAKAEDKQVIIFQKDNHGHIAFGVGKIDIVDSQHSGNVSSIKVKISPSADPNKALLAFVDELTKEGYLSNIDIAVATLGKAKKMNEFMYGPFQDGVIVMKSFTEDELLARERRNTQTIDSWVERWKNAGIVMWVGRENVPQYPFGKPGKS